MDKNSGKLHQWCKSVQIQNWSYLMHFLNLKMLFLQSTSVFVSWGQIPTYLQMWFKAYISALINLSFSQCLMVKLS